MSNPTHIVTGEAAALTSLARPATLRDARRHSCPGTELSEDLMEQANQAAATSGVLTRQARDHLRRRQQPLHRVGNRPRRPRRRGRTGVHLPGRGAGEARPSARPGTRRESARPLRRHRRRDDRRGVRRGGKGVGLDRFRRPLHRLLRQGPADRPLHRDDRGQFHQVAGDFLLLLHRRSPSGPKS